MYKKSLNNDKFKQRKFVLLGEQLFYYKKNMIGMQDKYYNLISLQNARISVLKASPEKLKVDKMYNYCFELENDTRTWILAWRAKAKKICCNGTRPYTLKLSRSQKG